MFSTKLNLQPHVVLEKVHWQIKRNKIWRAHNLHTPAILRKTKNESQDKEEMTCLEVTPKNKAIISFPLHCF